MNKIILITGPSGSGKTVLIENRFQGKEGYFVADFAIEFKNVFGSLNDFDDEDKKVDVLNHLCTEGFFALMDGKDIVMEFPVSGFSDELYALVKEAKKNGLKVKWMALSMNDNKIEEGFQISRKGLCSSMAYEEEHYLVLSTLITDFKNNRDFDEVCLLSSEGVEFAVFCMVREQEKIFFYQDDLEEAFDFEPDFEFEKLEGVKYVKSFSKLEDLFLDIVSQKGISNIFPVQVNDRYLNALKIAYSKTNQFSKHEIKWPDWPKHLN